jgi:predicted GNAT superfamily acetyltransferase
VTLSIMSTVDQDPQPAASAFNVAAQAERVAVAAARRAGVTVAEVEDPDSLREVSALLEAVWGRTDEGVPANSDILRGLVHAGGAVTTASSPDGVLVGAAVLGIAAPAGSTYSLIAAAAPDSRDRGIGQAVKLAQRAWALARGYRTMVWTFDPLVGRNARFNLAKLGAWAGEYELSFYGRMTDAINGTDETDRLVATWVLDSRRVVAATEGTADDPDGPAAGAEVVASGPDGDPMLVRDEDALWCRVPRDVVALRGTRPDEAAAWRAAVRRALVPALAGGLAATHMTRSGWYQLTKKEELR